MKQSDLQSNYSLVSLKVKLPGMSIRDKRASEHVYKEFNTTKQAGGFSKRKYHRGMFKPIQSIVSAARNYLYSVALPWTEDKDHILPGDKLSEFLTTMNDFHRQFMDERDEIVAQYSTHLGITADVLVDLFEPSEYPTAAEFEKEFKFEHSERSLDDISDFRNKLTQAEYDQLEAEYKRKQQEKIDTAMSELVKRIYKPLKHLATRLTDPEAKRYDKSMITNVIEILDIVPTFNITDSDDLKSISNDIKELLFDKDVADIKNNAVLKKDVIDKSTEILSRMDNLLDDHSAFSSDIEIDNEENNYFMKAA